MIIKVESQKRPNIQVIIENENQILLVMAKKKAGETITLVSLKINIDWKSMISNYFYLK